MKAAPRYDGKSTMLKRKRPGYCWVPGCKKKGETCIIDVDDDDGYAGEADVVLCEEHFAEARSAGQ